jgi:outer membrane cobalamin receptor
MGVESNPKVETQDTLKNEEISELVISARRVESELFTTPEAISLVSHKHQVQFQPRSTPELLSNVPGIFMQKTTHGAGSPFIRGLTGNQTLLIFDGIRLNNATYRYGPNQYLNTIDIFSIENVEVLRGSGSVQYGSDALSGTVQVSGRNIHFKEHGTWSGRVLGRFWSSDMEQSSRVETGYANRKIAIYGGYTYRNFGNLLGGSATGIQNPSGYSEQAFDLKSKVKLAANTIMTMAHNQCQQNDVPVYYRIKLENYETYEFNPQFRQLSYLKFERRSKSKWAKNSYLILSRQHTKEGRSSKKNGSNILRSESDEVESYGISSQVNSWISRRWQSNSGLEFYYEKVRSSRTDLNVKDGNLQELRGLYPGKSEFSSLAIFSLHEFNITQKLHLNLGARLNTFKISVYDTTLGSVILRPTALVWSAAAHRRVGRHFFAFGSYNSGFRSPNIDDLGTLGIVDFRYEVPNLHLLPEQSHNFQIGLKAKNQLFNAEIYLYRNELRHLISRIKTTDSLAGYPVYQKENLEKAFIQGIEHQLSFDIWNQLKIEGHLTYTFGQNISRNEPLRRIPPVNGRLFLRFQPTKKIFVGLEYLGALAQHRLAQGDIDDNRIPTGGTPGWNVFHLNSCYQSKSILIHLTLYNLFNKDYRLHGSGINAVGRSFAISLAYTFSGAKN